MKCVTPFITFHRGTQGALITEPRQNLRVAFLHVHEISQLYSHEVYLKSGEMRFTLKMSHDSLYNVRYNILFRF